MVTLSEIRPGAYFDSIVLMQLQRSLMELEGVLDAGVVMATPANLSLLTERDLLTADGEAAGADDLLIVVRANDHEAASAALTQVDSLLERRRSAAGQSFRPRSLEAAAKALPEALWVLISVPGRFAAGVAQQALDLGKHVFLYSDNVSLEDEVRLKQRAVREGLLLMGPDCGTAIVAGIGLGFANRVRRGSVGLVGASGTGLQAVTSAIHNLGGGVSHALGTGGRDLKTEVGAATAHQALDLLQRDADTRVIVLVSKPPAPPVAARLLAAAHTADKPVVVSFLGYAAPGRKLDNLHFAASLEDAAALAVELAESPPPAKVEEAFAGPRRYLRGLFSGGTLAYEALQGLQTLLHPIFSNIPSEEEQRLVDSMQSRAHTILDLGEDEFTVGRLHPMMDNELRLQRLRKEAADPEVALILLDVVLGEGSHPDPASELAPAIAEISGRGDVAVAALVVGTDEDPQDLEAQIERLADAGALIFRTTGEAVEYAAQRLSREAAQESAQVPLHALEGPLAAINVGLESFSASLQAQGARAVQVDWRPPAGGDERLMGILERMKRARD